MGRGRRLLEALEQGVLGLLVHEVGVVDDHRPRATLEGAALQLLDELPHLVDLEARLPGLGQQQVGVEAEVAQGGVPLVLDLAAQVGERLEHALRALTRRAPSAGVPALALADQGQRGLQGQGALAHALGAREEQGGRQPAALEGPLQQLLHPVVAEDAREGHPYRPRNPRALGHRAHAGEDLVLRARAADLDPALRVLRHERLVALAHPLVEVPRLALQPVGRAALPHPRKAQLDRHVEEDGQVGPQAGGGGPGEVVDRLQGQAAGVALVGEGGVGVPVGDHGAPLEEGRTHHLGHVLRAVGEVEERLGAGRHALAAPVEDDRADARADRGPSRLLGHHHAAAHGLREELHLGALAAALDALERDERHGEPRFYRECLDGAAARA